MQLRHDYSSFMQADWRMYCFTASIAQKRLPSQTLLEIVRSETARPEISDDLMDNAASSQPAASDRDFRCSYTFESLLKHTSVLRLRTELS